MPPPPFPFSHYTISRLQRLYQRQREPPDHRVGCLTDNVGVCPPFSRECLVNYQTSLQLSLELASILEAAMLNFHYYCVILL